VLKDAAGRLLAATVRNVIVLRRARNDIHIQEGRDLWWHRELEYVQADCPAEKLDSEAPLFILYTSGSTGKPKGILHTTGGYLLGAKLTRQQIGVLQDLMSRQLDDSQTEPESGGSGATKAAVPK